MSAKPNYKKTMNITETNLLLDLCEKYKNKIECKRTDLASNSLKEEGWKAIEKEFNNQNSIVRDVQTLKTKYKNMKYSTKSKLAMQRRSLYGTGGGPAFGGETTTTDEKMLGILNEKEVEGIKTNADCDAIDDAPQSPDIVEHLYEEIEKEVLTPMPGPSTLRSKISTQLRSCERKGLKETKWEKLANIKTKYTEEKLNLEIELVKKMKQQVDLQNDLLMEKHEIEMKILNINLEKAELELEKLKRKPE